jgi:DNA-binding MarR family transcriptional regulator
MPKFEDELSRLIQSLLRLSQVIASREHVAATARGIPALQLQILDILTNHDKPESVSSLARRLSITSATVSDSVKVMEMKGLVTKSRQPHDGRSVHIGITDLGQEIVASSLVWQDTLKSIVYDWDRDRRGRMMHAILSIIAGLQRDIATPIDRTCLSCRHFAINCDVNSGSVPFYCRAVPTIISETDLQIDCDLYLE